MQNKVVRFILNMDSRSHVGQDERNKISLLSVKDRVFQLKLNQVFKIYNDMSPEYLKCNFKRVSSTYSYSTRGSLHNFIMPRVQGQVRNTFYYTGIQHWNALPNSVKQIGNLPQFKKAVKKYLSEQAKLREQDIYSS